MPALALHALASSLPPRIDALAGVIRSRARADLDPRALLAEVRGDLGALRKAWRSYAPGEVPAHYPACRRALVGAALILRAAR